MTEDIVLEENNINNKLNICFFGGSNTFMVAGYVAPMVDRLGSLLNRAVNVNNSAIGNTFCYFGLYKSIVEKPHAGADIVVVEFAINDFEMLKGKGQLSWRRAFEGLIRKIRQENPTALVVIPILYGKARSNSDEPWRMANLNQRIGNHYGAVVIDARTELRTLLPDAEPSQLYLNPTHYNAETHLALGNRFAEIVAEHFSDRNRPALPDRLFGVEYSGAKTWISNGVVPEDLQNRRVLFENSRTSIQAITIGEGEKFFCRLKGEPLALITSATKQDGIIEIRFGDNVIYMSAHRRAVLPPSKWDFLYSNLIPAQAFGEPLPTSAEFVDFEVRLLTRSEEKDIPDDLVFMRGSSAQPPDNGFDRKLNLVDFMYRGTAEGFGISRIS